LILQTVTLNYGEIVAGYAARAFFSGYFIMGLFSSITKPLPSRFALPWHKAPR
jgi:hypothetical protein